MASSNVLISWLTSKSLLAGMSTCPMRPATPI